MRRFLFLFFIKLRVLYFMRYYFIQESSLLAGNDGAIRGPPASRFACACVNVHLMLSLKYLSLFLLRRIHFFISAARRFLYFYRCKRHFYSISFRSSYHFIRYMSHRLRMYYVINADLCLLSFNRSRRTFNGRLTYRIRFTGDCTYEFFIL